MSKRYQVTAERVGKFWHVEVPELGRVTQARNLREIPEMAKDVISIMTGQDSENFELDVVTTLPSRIAQHLAHAEQLRAQSSYAQSEAAREVRIAARELHSDGMPLRDVGKLLGVSYQRAHQLVS